MPVILAALLLILIVILLSVVLIPVTLVQRYRAGTARRLARTWLATINIAVIAFSIVIFLAGAGLTNIWVPEAFRYAAAGLAAGAAIGLAGLLLTRWERTGAGVYYTPNRWLVLGLTIAVSARIAYGFWRSWNAWQSFGGEASWITAAGVAGSLAAGAVILGYYFVFWIGVRRRAIAATIT